MFTLNYIELTVAFDRLCLYPYILYDCTCGSRAHYARAVRYARTKFTWSNVDHDV